MANEEQKMEINTETSELKSVYDSSVKAEEDKEVKTSNSDENLVVNQDIESVESEAEAEKNLIPDLTEKINNLETKLQESNQKYETLNNNHLRLNAEFDNYRKRSVKEKEDLEIKVSYSYHFQHFFIYTARSKQIIKVSH